MNDTTTKIEAAEYVKFMRRAAGYTLGNAEAELIRMRNAAKMFLDKIDEFLGSERNSDPKTQMNELRFQMSRVDELVSQARVCKEHVAKLDAYANICLFDAEV